MRTAAFAALTLFAAWPAFAQQPARSESSLAPGSTLLNVTAYAETRREPDIATVNAGVVTQGKTAADAAAANARQMEAVVAALRRAGVAPADIQTSALSLQPQFYYPERERFMRERAAGAGSPPPPPEPAPPQPEAPRIVGYDARNQVSVRIRRASDVGRIFDAAVAAGANQVDGPYFSIDEPEAALDQARTEALRRARERAELYARAAGLRVGRIVSISEGGGVYPVSDIVVTASSGSSYGAPPPPPTQVSPGRLSLQAAVSVQFELVR